MKKQLVIFASGRGSNAQTIIQHFASNGMVEVSAVLSNNEHSGALSFARESEIEAISFTKEDLEKEGKIESYLNNLKPDLIVLAGFLLKFPKHLVDQNPNRIVNIHPALLPKFGGKGMYGMHVHQAVVDAHEKESGITIHYVNENYDEGAIIAQFSCAVLDNDTPELLQEKIQTLEKRYFPVTIEKILSL